MTATMVNREQSESTITEKVYALFEEYQNEAIALLGVTGIVANLTAHYYGRLLNDFQSLIQPELILNYMNSAQGQADEFGYVLDSGDLEYEATQWANSWSYELAQGVVETTRSQIARISHEARRLDSMSEVNPNTDFNYGLIIAGAVVAVFSLSRATKIAISEVTRAITAGKRSIVDRLMKEFGIESEGIWVCGGPDPCNECRNLDGTPQSIWAMRYPSGSPAHPHCSCDIFWTLQ